MSEFKLKAKCIAVGVRGLGDDAEAFADLELFSEDGEPKGGVHLNHLELEQVKPMLYREFDVSISLSVNVAEPADAVAVEVAQESKEASE